MKNLTKVYSNNFVAVDSISFSVEEGEIFGLLGPNGAGKTTTIKIITTISQPTAGEVLVFGMDVTKYPEKVRSLIGYVPQAISVDGDLTGYENLLIFSKLSYVSKSDREERIRFALEYMGLKEKANDLVKHYSGGMMRRLEIAQAIVNRPKLLILDEPTIGLDPSSKRQIWDYLLKMNKELNTTILMTTHDMQEADNLCHRIAIMNAGKIAIIGNPSELKESVGGDVITLNLDEYSEKAIKIISEFGNIIGIENSTVKIATRNAENVIPKLLEHMFSNEIKVKSISYKETTLDDVFLKYAKVSFEQGERFRDARMIRRVYMRHGK